MPELSSATQNLINEYKKWYKAQQPPEGISTIHVDEVASKVAAFYEKIREVVDWKEEHLMRRSAIERILKRRLFLKENLSPVTRSLLLELVRGGHFPNDRIPESRINELQRIIDKYLFIFKNSPRKGRSPIGGKPGPQLYNWILSIAACEIEETLSTPIRENALTSYMESILSQRIKLKVDLSDNEKETQIFVAIQKGLLRSDISLISYRLIRRIFPNWSNLSVDELNLVTLNIFNIWSGIEKDLHHPLADRFYQICEKYDTPYLILDDVISKNAMEIENSVKKPEVLEGLIRAAYNKRIKTLKTRLRRAAIYSTLSIFLTNILVLLAIEIPFTKYVTGHLNSLAITIDILGPTLLMAILVTTIRPPKSENLLKVIIEVMKIVYQRDSKDIYEIKPFPKRSLVLGAIIQLFYLLGFLVTVGAIIWTLSLLHFPLLSYIIFIVFLSLISFAGAKIRERAKELQIIGKREGIWRIFIDPFSVPFVQFGRWLSSHWRKYNILTVFFNSLIDMPFIVFVEFLEQWRYFLKEKKEQIH